MEIEEREIRQRERNAAAAVRGQVLKVLQHETVEIRLYLDRPTPCAVEALARLANIEELLTKLQDGRI